MNPPEGAQRVAVVGVRPRRPCLRLGARSPGRLQVAVIERDDRAGGLLMYGIPNMKLEKSVVERRTKLMEELGIEFA